MSKNSLFNYFKKVDSKNNTPAKVTDENVDPNRIKLEKSISKKLIIDDDDDDKENTKSAKNNSVKKIVESSKQNDKMEVELYDDENDDEDVKRPTSKSVETPKNAKRKRIMVLSDSDSDENDAKEKTIEKKKKAKRSLSDDEEYDAKKANLDEYEDSFIDDEDDEETTKKKTKKKTVISKKNLDKEEFASPKNSKSKSTAVVSSPAGKSALDSYASNFDADAMSAPTDIKFKHLSFYFLEEDKIKDIEGRKKSDPNYDPKTLFVPPEFKKTLTPALRQWFELKSTNFDVIFFFKVGKFYELYHQDAVIAVKELGLSFMRGDYAHCGFPEIAFSKFADALVSKGYKVGRVEQTETPDMMNERIKGTKQDKTVRREICRITTPGTKTFNILDSDMSDAFSRYLFSIIEKITLVQDKKVRTFGVCFVDTTVGKIHIGQFEDDRNCSKLRTTFAQYPPAQILYDRNNISKESKGIIEMQNGIKEGLVQDKEMYTPGKLLRMLTEKDYFKAKDEFQWPENFKPCLSDQDTLGLTAKSDYELAVNAFGGVVWCLINCLIDNEILSMKNFEIYHPVDNLLTNDIKKSEMRQKLIKQKYMILDSISLTNLEIIENNYDNTQAGTLYEQLDFCNTHFGKRLLKYWIVNPLCDPDAINDRLNAIEDLQTIEEKLPKVTEQLKSLPDLERLISKIHQVGNVRKDHPESRAIMYENDTYSKKKIDDFISILNGFNVANDMLSSLKGCCSEFKSKLLKSILSINKEKETKKLGFPYLNDLLQYYKDNFNANEAKTLGKIIPMPGVCVEYDQAIKEIKRLEKELQNYLEQQRKELKCSVSYFGNGKNRYQLEIPENKADKLSDDYTFTSSKKGFKRFTTSELKEMIDQLSTAEKNRDEALRDTIKSYFKNFDKHYDVWNRAVQCLSILDVLISLMSYVKNASDVMCRPEILVMDDDCNLKSPFIEIVNGRHPCLTKTFSGDFIPNDILIGCEDANNNWQKNPLLILTGPNMGGKSTLMRQTGLTVILAQMGCYVPAEKCRLSPVDRIFTRIGASDKILQGESTFFLELSETASILHHATKHSFVLMDELGRGTATFDGTAIAYSVVKELAQRIKCRTLFSTHYHHLVEEFSDKDNVSMGHMQSMVNDDDQSITFLYKFGEGACPKSHGFNAARLADIPEEIIKLGSIKAVEFENHTKRIQLLKKILHSKSKKDINDIISKFDELKC